MDPRTPRVLIRPVSGAWGCARVNGSTSATKHERSFSAIAFGRFATVGAHGGEAGRYWNAEAYMGWWDKVWPSRDYLRTSIVQDFPGNRILRVIPWTKDGILARHLSATDRVLDLGPGPRSVLGHYKVAYSLGVEMFDPYLEAARRAGTHTEVLKADVSEVEFDAESFDVVVAFDVFDHLEKRDALQLIEKCKIWAGRELIAVVTNGHADPPILDHNEYQRHRCGFGIAELHDLGFKTYGLGIKLPGMNSSRAIVSFVVRRLSFPLWFLSYWWPQIGYDVVGIYGRRATRWL